MNRASLLALGLSAVWAVVFQTGCVTQEKYDKLLISARQAESDRDALRNQLAAANARLEALDQEKATWSADKKAQIDTLLMNIQRLEGQVAQLTADNTKMRDLLGQKAPPTIEIRALPAGLSAKLKDFAQKNPGLMEFDEKTGLVRFSSDLLFNLGSFDLQPEVLKKLGDFAEIINIPEAQMFDVLVVGHTDNVKVSRPQTKAITPTNWHLSVYRAVSVVQALDKDKVSPKRLGAMGFGEERPRVPNKGAGGTKENRRVEIYLVPKGSLMATTMAPRVLHGEDIAAIFDR